MVLFELGHTETHCLQYDSFFASSAVGQKKLSDFQEIFESCTNAVKIKQLGCFGVVTKATHFLLALGIMLPLIQSLAL